MNEGTVICASVLEITSCWDMRGSVTWLTATAAETMLLITHLLFTCMQFALSCRVIKVHAVKSNWLNVPRVISAVWTPGKTGLFALDQLSILNSSLPILQEEWVHCFCVPKNKSSDSRAPSLFSQHLFICCSPLSWKIAKCLHNANSSSGLVSQPARRMKIVQFCQSWYTGNDLSQR